MDDSSRPGWGWFRGSIPVATSNDRLGSRSGVILISECYWYMEHAPSSTAALERLIAGTYGSPTSSEGSAPTKACVAVANKNARIIWALLAKDKPYRVAA